MARELTDQERNYGQQLLMRARAAMDAVRDYDQQQVDRLCRAVGWATANEKTFTRIAQRGVDESGLGDRAGRPAKRFKIMGILRDALRQKSMGAIEELPDKGIVKYAKPAGVVAALIPSTNPELTPPGIGIYALKCKDAVIFSPHPASRQTTAEMVSVMRHVAEARCTGRPVPMRRISEHSAGAGTHVHLRRDRGDRWHAHGAGGL
jgi:sulfoacetaldehyde dehydrogenase